MSEGQVVIAIDAMGGENSPYKVLRGVEIFLHKEKNTKIIFFGDEVQINKNIKKYNLNIFNYEVLNTQDIISDEDSVNTILRSKKNSSIYKGLEFAKKNLNSGFVSSGSTAAIMVLSRLHMGMIEGIDRPAICSLIPNKKNYSLMLDLGANVIVSGSNLFQFALMGYCYYSIINKNSKLKILHIYNKAEKIKQFPGMSQPAIMPPKESKAGKNYKDSFESRHGFDPYANEGFIPNFAQQAGATLVMNKSPLKLFGSAMDIGKASGIKWTQVQEYIENKIPITLESSLQDIILSSEKNKKDTPYVMSTPGN